MWVRTSIIAGCIGAVVVLICLCFASLEFTEIGINYSWFTSSIEERGFGAGRYFLGLGHEFIKFPSTVQSISFSPEAHAEGGPLRSRTSDGLEVSLELSFQYQLNESSVVPLYLQYGADYEPFLVNVAMNTLGMVATLFNATTFFNDRTAIGLHMEDSLKTVYENRMFCTVPFFQLRAVTLPPDFENAIQETEVKKQDIQTALAEKDNKRVEMETEVLRAQQQAIQIAYNANATAQSTLLFIDANVLQFNLNQKLQAQSFTKVFAKFGKNETLLMEYLRMRAMREHPDHLSIVSLN